MNGLSNKKESLVKQHNPIAIPEKINPLFPLLEVRKKNARINKKVVKFSERSLLAYIASKGEKIVRINTMCEHFELSIAEILVAKRQVTIDKNI